MNPISLILLAGLTLLVTIWLKSLPRKKRNRTILMIAIALTSLFLVLMAVTGRLHWVVAVFAGLLPFIRRFLPILIKALPFIGAWYKRRQNSRHADSNQSSMDSSILSLKVDHDSGVMYGTIKSGPFKGQDLGTLSEQNYIKLLDFCRQNDPKASQLLEIYLDKRFGDSWREDDTQASSTHHNSPEHLEAYKVLGLKPGCSREDIINAHRRLMQKNHPDRGGSDYLAAKINEAKDFLLND